jgi:hypothetical protein
MTHGNRTFALALVLGLGLATASDAAAAAGGVEVRTKPDSAETRGGSAPLRAPLHGGVLSTVDTGRFETVFALEGLQVYVYTEEGAPAMVEAATGKAVVTVAGGRSVEVPLAMEIPTAKEPAVYFCPMHPEVVRTRPGVCDKCGGMRLYTQNRLAGRIDLSQAKRGSVTADVALRGLSGKVKEARFSVNNAATKAKIPGSPGTGAKPEQREPSRSGQTVKRGAPKDAGTAPRPAK